MSPLPIGGLDCPTDLRRAAGLLLLALTACSDPSSAGSHGGAAPGPPATAPTQLAEHRQLLLEDEPASCTVALDLDRVAGLALAEVVLTVVAPDGQRSAEYAYGPLPATLERAEPLRLGVGETEQEALVMYEVAPLEGSLWADVMASRSSLTLTRVHGTPEERLGGW